MLSTASGHSDPFTSRLPTLIRSALGAHWEFTFSGPRVEIRHSQRGTPYRPPRRSPTWKQLLVRLEAGFLSAGAPRRPCLPLRCGRDTELTISAVQALDPLLKDGNLHTYRSGFLAQPVVRFTGERDSAGLLRPGFLTSFVNVSRVQPIQCFDEYAGILDSWITVLSQLGFHARHLSFHGALTPWRRRQVAGMTLHFRHLDTDLGDIVLLWNVARPDRLAVDLGVGLERLAWARTQGSWSELIYGRFAPAASVGSLDAVRTATLLIGHGIVPAARGAGGITRRVIRTIDRELVRFGVSSLVRDWYAYWSLFDALCLPWPEVARVIEEEARRWVPAGPSDARRQPCPDHGVAAAGRGLLVGTGE